MKREFEKYFPLPWEVKIIDTATFIQSEFEPGEHTIKFNADNIAHVDALEYMVKCANLMPEAVELLGKCAIEMQKRCDYCAGKGGRACIGCSNSEMRTEIHALLAQLEGDVKNA